MTPAAALVVLLAGGLAAASRGTAASSQAAPEPADLLLIGGRILTVDDRIPEAQAAAIRGDRIAALGAATEIARYRGASTEVIDLNGRLVVPGFVESHAHFTGVGEAAMQLKLMDAASWPEIVARVAAAVRGAKPGAWIVGRGWHQEKWTSAPAPAVEGFPTHASLDAVSPRNPVLLTHASGHAAFANGEALRVAKITRATPNPPGGEILKDERGEPTGLLRETAADLVRPDSGGPAGAERAMELASAEALSKGITTFQDAGSSFATIDVMKRLVDARRIGVRLWVMVSEPNAALAQGLARYRTIDYGGGRLTVRAIKRQIDGALGSRGAWLLAPYSDSPGSAGLETTPVAEIEETARLALANGYQLCVHAIGDRANRETLDLFERAFGRARSGRDLRWRIEHAQHLSQEDIPRFARLGVIASMQAIHASSDAPYVLDRLGPRRAEEGAYAWRSLMRSGAVIANGTDAPVEDLDPIANYHAAVTRETLEGRAFYPAQRMTRMEALRAATLNGAYAAFQEDSRGSLAVGKLADLAVLSRDITAVDAARIRETRVDYTIVGGRVAYRR